MIYAECIKLLTLGIQNDWCNLEIILKHVGSLQILIAYRVTLACFENKIVVIENIGGRSRFTQFYPAYTMVNQDNTYFMRNHSGHFYKKKVGHVATTTS